MSVIKRGCFAILVLASAVAANADLNYSNIDATVTFEDSSTSNLTVLQHNNGLDIFAGNEPLYVASVNSTHTSATVNISYDATSTTPINEVDLMFTGMTLGLGTIGYTETVFDSSNNVLATTSGTLSGNNAFIQNDPLTFGNVDAFHVEKTFTLNLTGQQPGVPQASLASLGIIQQNAVPEPASFGALALGAVGLLARRKRK
jgi:hypothetical protein